MASRKNGDGTGKRQKPVPPVEHQFKPGNPGRPKGSRNKLGEAFLEAMATDFEEHGAAAISKVREDDPSAYMRVIASTLPKELKIEKPALSEMSDDELTRLIDIVRATVGPTDAAGSGDGEAGGRKPPSDLPTLQ